MFALGNQSKITALTKISFIFLNSQISSINGDHISFGTMKILSKETFFGKFCVLPISIVSRDCHV